MKKRIVLCLLVSMMAALLLHLAALPSFQAENDTKTEEAAAMFPSELQIIGEEAFKGTSFEEVVFRDNLTTIEDQAFDETDSLTAAYIPPSVEDIGASAFPRAVTIHGVSGSYAEKWAEENKFDFTADDIWTDAQSAEGIHLERLFDLFWIVCLPEEKTLLRFSERIRRFFRSMRPQDRPELHSIRLRFP